MSYGRNLNEIFAAYSYKKKRNKRKNQQEKIEECGRSRVK